jgi:hypothetical protein
MEKYIFPAGEEEKGTIIVIGWIIVIVCLIFIAIGVLSLNAYARELLNRYKRGRK